MTQTIEQLQARIAELEAQADPDALHIAYLQGQATANETTRKQAAWIKELEVAYTTAVLNANECRLTLLHQVHELADHIERANYCINDPDMLKQMNGQREYAMEVSSKWNQNGNPFLALSELTEALDKFVAEKVKEATIKIADELQAGRLQWMVRETASEEKVATLTRQRDLAVEALTKTLAALRMPCDRWSKIQSEIVSKAVEAAETALSTIKESEGT